MSSQSDDMRKAKAKKQEKKMTKILSKAWSLDRADIFQQVESASLSTLPVQIGLQSVGDNLEKGTYPLGRKGWEKFAGDIGFVYNQFILSGKKVKIAKEHLKEVCTFLAKIEPSLVDIANNSKNHSGATNAEISANSIGNRKRKASPAPNIDDSTSQSSIPKKRNTSNQSTNSSAILTTSQREEKAMNNLMKYIVECGGEEQQVSSFRCKVVLRNYTSSSGEQQRYETSYFNEGNRKFRSMVEVARFLNLKVDGDGTNGSGSGASNNNNVSTLVIKKGRPRNIRELEAEQKRLRKELDKLVKAHGKATKAVDDFLNEKGNDTKQVDDDLLVLQNSDDQNEDSKIEKESENGVTTQSSKNQILQQSLWNASKPENKEQHEFSFPGIPSSCTQDLLMVWDFLCTFSRTLSLEPIDLDNFIAALNYVPPEVEAPQKPLRTNDDDDEYIDEGEALFDENKTDDPLALATKSAPPIYLAEAHMALMKLLLKDLSSEKWWWSILETPELEALEMENTASRGEADNIAPTIKVDIVALLDFPDEDITITRRWLQALEDVRERRTNSGGAIKSAVKSASSITKNPYVKTYLRKSLLHWQGNAASFTKQSVMWLIRQVREARPDLWGRKMDQEALSEQKAKVAQEAVSSMSQLEDAPDLEDDNIQLGDSDDEDSDSDDDENNQSDEETSHNFNPKKLGKNEAGAIDGKNAKDEMTPVTSSVPTTPPPTLVDLLLPPSKPLHNSQILCAFTWPTLTGAFVCRILHRFKRLRNEVDDSLREFRGLSRMTIKERLERESRMVPRVFSECVAVANQSQTSIDETMTFLCKGGEYLALSPLHRLSILRILIEATYDTDHVYQCVQDNITSRKNAVTQLEKEERNARKAAKEAAVVLEQAARQRLAQDALNEFMTKKRREISRTNKHTNEFTQEMIDSLTVDEIIDMDEDNKIEYEALPTPQQFSKREVSTMVTQIAEENAFNTTHVEIMTVEEIEAREETLLTDSRKAAIASLKEAIEDGTIKALKSAIRVAKNEYLCGDLEDDNGMWALDLLRDAVLELKEAEKRKKVTEAKKDLVAKRNKCFVRTEELGSDRFRNKYWKFDQDLDGRIWLEADFAVKEDFDEKYSNNTDIINSPIDVKSVLIGAPDEEKDFCAKKEQKFITFSRQEYNLSGLVPSLAMRRSTCISSSASLRGILKHLDGRGLREGALKYILKELVEDSGGNTADHQESTDANDRENYETEMESHMEQDEPRLALSDYRNKMGRFCGRAADAPYAASSLYLGKLLLKREQECYMLLKNRALENNWGGKNGARNAWIASMKEHSNNITAVRDGLLTLEDAIFELCDGFKNEEENSKDPPLSGREILDKRETRFEIELESSVQQVNGLWNSKSSRLVFREIISSTENPGLIALGLDLLCRNCTFFLESTKSKVTTRNKSSYQNDTAAYMGRMTRSSFTYDNRESFEEHAVSSRPRRMNAWQQRQNNANMYLDD